MKISKSKRQLAQLLIDAGVKQFPDGAEWAAQDGSDAAAYYYTEKPIRVPGRDYYNAKHQLLGSSWVELRKAIPNWHRTALSRAEFDQIVAESAEQSKPDADGWVQWKGGECPVGDRDLVFLKMRYGGMWRFGNPVSAGIMKWGHDGDESDIIAYCLHKPEQVEPQYCESVARAIPEPVTAPTLDQLLQDYRNASDFAAAKQDEADEAAKMRDKQWKAVQARACELGVHISVELVVDAEMRESEPVITDWRDLRVGDIVMVVGCSNNPGWNRLYGVELEVVAIGYSEDELCFKPKDGERWYCGDNTRWVFIRRP
ncbi:MAG: hypothetical protein ACRCXB_28495 [Aeromonadaceae bacterium]